jgi:protein-L-isoaspartate(D-aspartate) O-methyltransferase
MNKEKNRRGIRSAARALNRPGACLLRSRLALCIHLALPGLIGFAGCYNDGGPAIDVASAPGAAGGTGQAGQDTAWKKDARRMVDAQIRARGVTDHRVLRAMQETPRHYFVPAAERPNAWDDYPLPIGHGQTISQPYIVAWMTELLQLKGDEKVLEIGTGSGYQAAVLAQLAREVFTIEIVKALADSSMARMQWMGHANVTVRWGDGYRGWPEEAPFDRILLTAAPERIPPELLKQLKPGGRMVLPVGEGVQQMKVIVKNAGGSFDETTEGLVRFVPMVHPGDSPPGGNR